MNLEWTKYFIKQRSNHKKYNFDYIKLKSSHYPKIQKAYSEENQDVELEDVESIYPPRTNIRSTFTCGTVLTENQPTVLTHTHTKK